MPRRGAFPSRGGDTNPPATPFPAPGGRMPPRSLRRGLPVAAFGVLLLLGVAAVAALPAVSHGVWPLVTLAALLAGLLAIPTGPRFRGPRRLLAGFLACWLGLLGWAQFSRGGP